jgi:hypothetical protein
MLQTTANEAPPSVIAACSMSSASVHGFRERRNVESAEALISCATATMLNHAPRAAAGTAVSDASTDTEAATSVCAPSSAMYAAKYLATARCTQATSFGSQADR